MFVRFWILWAVAGLAIATWLFRWAVVTGQFDDARRAALLPLDDVKPRSCPPSSGRLHLFVLVGVAVVGVLLTSLTVLMALLSG
jgi:nitrogen fixation-related uncharacterized protein